MWHLYTNPISHSLRTAPRRCPDVQMSLALWPVLNVCKWSLVVRERLQVKRGRC